MINLFQPSLGAEELAAVEAVFADNWIGRGARTAEFERRFADHIGADANQVRSLNSCTEGLFLAVELLVPAGSEVILPSISFVGAANAIVARGATPVFCDVDPRTLNTSVGHIEQCLTPRTSAVVVLHYGGYPGEIEEIARFCRERDLVLIEDAACAVASRVDEKPCGTFGDIGLWSFDGMKILSTGDGGMVYARDPEIAAKISRVSYLGMEQASGFQQASNANRWWEFTVSSPARRSIMNDITAAIGLVQLRRLAEFVETRRAMSRQYDQAFADVPGLALPTPLPTGHVSSHYMYWIQTEPTARDDLAKFLYESGIYTTFRYHPLHRVPLYGSSRPLPGAESAADRTLCLPLHQALAPEEVKQVTTSVTEWVERRGDAEPLSSG